jgi:ADP-L-glycero-D-manno-heptose 6-epimerase
MIIVTGAAGFIGSNILSELDAGNRGPLIACDNLRNGSKWLNISKIRIANYLLPTELHSFLMNNSTAIKAVIHMGAVSSTTEINVDRLVANNIIFSQRLWDWCAEWQVPFIYASSAATYGSLEQDLFDRQDEAYLAGLRPLNAYGWSKNAFDLMIASRLENGQPAPPQWAGLKFFNVYGPNEYHKGDMQSVIAKLFSTVRDGGVVKLFKSSRPGVEDGQQMRDFIYVKDCTRVVLWLLDNHSTSGIFNVGTGVARSFSDLVTVMGLVINRSVNIEYIDMPSSLHGKYQYFTRAEMGKLRSAGMVDHFYSLDEGIEDYFTNYLSSQDPYR